MKPGLLAGFADAQQNKAFDGLWGRLTRDHTYWCCAAEIGPWTSFKYELPQPFSSKSAQPLACRLWYNGLHWPVLAASHSQYQLLIASPAVVQTSLVPRAARQQPSHPPTAHQGLLMSPAVRSACPKDVCPCRLHAVCELIILGHSSLLSACSFLLLPPCSAGGYHPWQPPTMEVPKWCADIAANERQREYVFYANHPCQFLTNKTAQAVAAALE